MKGLPHKLYFGFLFVWNISLFIFLNKIGIED